MFAGHGLDSAAPFDPAVAPGPVGLEMAEDFQNKIFDAGIAEAAEMCFFEGFPAAKAPPMQRPLLSTVAVIGSDTKAGDYKPTSFAEAFVLLGLPDPLHAPFLSMVDATSDDDPAVLAELPFDTFQQEVRGSLMLVDGGSPSLMQQAHCFKFFKALARLFSVAPPVSSPAAASSSSAPVLVQLPDQSHKMPMRDYIDQTLVTERFSLLSEQELAGLRKRFIDITGAHPSPEERPSDEQLSALAHRMRGGRHTVPFVEFAVWGPFDGRSAKLRVFSAHVLSREGTWHVKTRSGPANFVAWEASFTVMAAAFIMLGIASPGALKTYHQAIRKLVGLFPQELWPTIASLEEEIRAERWTRLRQEINDGVTAAPAGYDPLEPWKTLVAASRPFFLQGPLADWWQDRITLLDRARTSRAGPKPSAASVVPGVLPSFVGMPVMPALAGNGSLALEDKPTHPSAPQPKAVSKKEKKRRAQQETRARVPDSKKQKTNDPNVETRTCHNCGQVGHIQANCPSQPSGGRGRGGRGRGRGRA